MNERYFWVAIIAAVIIWTGNYTYLQSKQLSEPIFLKHYYEIPIEERTPLEFYYIANNGDTRTVDGISVNGLHFYSSWDGYMFQHEGPVYKKEYIHHQLRSFRVEIHEGKLPIERASDNEWSFTEITPSFNAGSGLDQAVDIGYVNLSGKLPQKPPFKFKMSGSSSNHRSKYEMSAKEALLIEEVEIPLLDEFPGLVEMKINAPKVNHPPVKKDPEDHHGDLNMPWGNVNGTSMQDIEFPIEIEKDDWVSFYMEVDQDSKMYLRFNIRIKGTSAEGEAFEIPLHIWDEPHLNQKDINELISEQQGGEDR